MTRPLCAGDEQRHRIEAELVSALASMHLMQRPDSRELFMNVLRQRLDHQVQIRDYPEPRHQAVEIVGGCLRVPSALTVMLSSIELLEPDPAHLVPLRRLQHEYEAIEVLSPEDWSELRIALEEVGPEDPGRLCQRATDHQLASPPAWCTTAWDMFIYLAGRNALRDGLPPAMLLLLLLELEVDTDQAARLRRHNQRQATALGLTAELDRRRAVIAAGSDLPPDPFVYLVVQIAPDLQPDTALTAPEQYTVSHYRQWQGDGAWHSQLCGQIRKVSYPDLEATVARAVREMEREWSSLREAVVVELVLPLTLLNEDVAWWRTDERTDLLPERVLAMEYPVVIRSLERLREKEWHRKWGKRWQLLHDEPVRSQLYRSQPDGGVDYFTRLEAELNSDLHRASLLLSEPPSMETPNGLREVMTALRAGLPVVLWHRTQATTHEFWEEIQAMAAGQINRLPIHVQRYRLAALRAASEQRAGHAARHLAVLWDDPERRPELDATTGYEPAGYEGAGR